ncbi:MAG: sugar ABC transporter permease [Ornithinimicrobium sp.]
MTTTTQPDASPTAADDAPTAKPPLRKDKFLLFLSLPALVLYLFWTIVPVVFVFVFAFFDYGGLLDFVGSDGFVDPERFTGWENTGLVLNDLVFWTAVRNTAIQVGIAVPVMIPLAFMLGFYLDRRPPGWKVLSVFFFTPGLISISIKGTIFYAMLSPNGGVNGVLDLVGLGSDGMVDLTTAWYADASTALAVIIVADLWQGIGWTGVLFAARLASMPTELSEAAEVDGATQWQRMWRVSFGVVRDYVGTMAMLQFLWTLFNSAPIVFILTGGGPGTSSTTLSFLVYQKAFIEQQIGYSQVVGVLLFVCGLGGMVLIRRVFRES